MARYRLPEALGGGEYEEYRHVDGGTEAPVGTVAFLLDGCVFTVARRLLTEVKPPLPPQPASGIVTCDEYLWNRVGNRPGALWRGGDTEHGVTWAELCERDTPVVDLLIIDDPYKDSEQVALPWRSADGSIEVDRAVGCGCHGEEDGARLVRVSMDTPAHLEIGEAKAFAYALLAADQAEAVSTDER